MAGIGRYSYEVGWALYQLKTPTEMRMVFSLRDKELQSKLVVVVVDGDRSTTNIARLRSCFFGSDGDGLGPDL